MVVCNPVSQYVTVGVHVCPHLNMHSEAYCMSFMYFRLISAVDVNLCVNVRDVVVKSIIFFVPSNIVMYSVQMYISFMMPFIF